MAKSSRPLRPGNNLPWLVRFVPLLPILLFSLIWGAGGGCSQNFSAVEARQRELSQSSIQEAVQAESEGDGSRADAAARDAVRVLQAFQGESEATVAVARELMRAGRPHPALRLLKAATQSPALNDNPNVYLMLALAQEQVGNQTLVASSLEEAARRAESLRNGSATTADKSIARVRDLLLAGTFWADPENPRASKEKALDALQAAYAIAPDNPFVQNALGYTLADLGTTPAEWKQGLDLTRKAADQLADNSVVLDSVGWALYRTGDLEQSVYFLRKAVDLDEGIPELHCHLGIVFAARKQYPEAATELERAIQLWPQYEQAQQALKALPPDARSTPAPTPLPTPLNAPVSAPGAATSPSASSSPAPEADTAGK